MCRLLTTDFPDWLQWKEIKLVTSEGVGKVSRIKRTVKSKGLKKWEDSFHVILAE